MDPYGSDHTYSGGNAYSHFLSCNIFFEAVMRKDSQILDEKENKIGHIIRATTEKSKFAPWPRKCEFKVNFDLGVVDSHEEMVKLAIDMDIIKRPNNVMYEYKDLKIKGEAATMETFKNDRNLFLELEAAIKNNNIALPVADENLPEEDNDDLSDILSKSKKKKKDKVDEQ
jgi:hypothetical protein